MARSQLTTISNQTDALVAECEAAKEAARAAWKQWKSDSTFRYDEALLDVWRSAWLEAIAERDAMYPQTHAYFEDLLRIRNHVWVSSVSHARSVAFDSLLTQKSNRRQRMFAEYRTLLSRWQQERQAKDNFARVCDAPGSPVKSPTKSGNPFRASSPSHKEDLLRLTCEFWSINEPGKRNFASERLQGCEGERAVRSLLVSSASSDHFAGSEAESGRLLQASCAYSEPLRSTHDTSNNLLNRLTAALPNTSSLTAIASTLASIPSPAVAKGPQTITPPSDNDNDENPMEMVVEESYTQGEVAWSQVPDELWHHSTTTPVSSTTSSQTVGATVIVSSNPVGPATAAPPPRPDPVLLASICPRGVPSGQSLGNVAGHAAIRFCFDMAHRDVNALKADSFVRRMHDGNPTAAGIQAPKLAPHMVSPQNRLYRDCCFRDVPLTSAGDLYPQLDVLQVSKRCAGLTQVRARVRPRTLLTPSSSSEAAESLVSPAAKRARLL